MIWVVDHNDSFVANLARYFTLLRQNVTILSMDECIHATQNSPLPNAVILSPGPNHPADYPGMIQWIQQHHQRVPMLGVCLGHQMLAEALGGKVLRAQRPRHGIATSIQHNQTGLFQLLPKGFLVAHYHALIVKSPGPFNVDAVSQEGEIMGISHPTLPLYGLQYHPESVLTEFGLEVCHQFLQLSDDLQSNRLC